MSNATQAPATAEGPTQHTQKTGGALAIRPDQTQWTEQQAAVLRQSGIKDEVTAAELSGFLHLCQRTGLDPFSRQIYLIGRKDKRAGREVYTPQTGIDGYRVIAQRVTAQTGGTYGYEDTVWCDPSGRWRDVWLVDAPPAAAKVTVIRNGQRFSAVATFREYVQTFPDGNPKGLWAKMPAGQIAKCAETLALRKAFPHDLAGVYTAEEMEQADNPAPAQMPSRDYIAEAQSAESAGMVRTVWQNAKHAGAPVDVLNRIAEVGQEKAAAEQPTSPHSDAAVDDIVEGEIVTEDGVTPESAEQGPASAGPSQDEMLNKLYRQAIANRSSVGVLKQITDGAKQEGVIDMEVDGPPPAHERMTFGTLLDLLLADAQAASQERNAA
ncbi:phage recombination protein Bet [Streptomyces sp. NPDC093589]|uniref:phage recombination protein Bet n=1 Tax=Streptomyces sp. NPDC093589 TaxID=3366043 RepID=UPI00380DCAB5